MTEPQEPKIYKSIQEGLLDCAKRGIENYYSHKNDIELEQLIWDNLVKELKEHHNEQMNVVLLNPDAYKTLKEVTDNSFFGKLRRGFKFFHYSYQDWRDVMVSGDYVEEFFEYLGNCEIYE